ncbi:MAG: hypothetical protein ACJA2W_000008 [Planctomycetota bacterium]|jgi:hypothetical protein
MAKLHALVAKGMVDERDESKPSRVLSCEPRKRSEGESVHDHHFSVGQTGELTLGFLDSGGAGRWVSPLN